MTRHVLLALFLCCLLWAPCVSQAHRVNVFAYVEGDAIHVECSFSKSNRVRNGKLVFLDRETEEVVRTATTDEQGLYTLKSADIAPVLAKGHGLLIRLVAGEGHQNEWEMDASELVALAGASSAKALPCAQEAFAATTQPQALPEPGLSDSRPVTSLSEQELEALVARVVDARLASIHKALAREDEPSLRDIVGGIGWILGLLGLATYLRYRPR